MSGPETDGDDREFRDERGEPPALRYPQPLAAIETGDQTGVICSNCGTDNRPGAKFCMECETLTRLGARPFLARLEVAATIGTVGAPSVPAAPTSTSAETLVTG